MSKNGQCIVERGARYKVYAGTTSSQLLSHHHWHTHADGNFFSTSSSTHHVLGKCARAAAEQRASLFRYAIDHGRSLKERRRAPEEGFKLQVELQPRSHSNRRTDILNSIPLPFANALSVRLPVWTAARPAERAVPPSKRKGKRTTRWRERGVLSLSTRKCQPHSALDLQLEALFRRASPFFE